MTVGFPHPVQTRRPLKSSKTFSLQIACSARCSNQSLTTYLNDLTGLKRLLNQAVKSSGRINLIIDRTDQASVLNIREGVEAAKGLLQSIEDLRGSRPTRADCSFDCMVSQPSFLPRCPFAGMWGGILPDVALPGRRGKRLQRGVGFRRG